MDLSFYARSAVRAQRSRERVKRNGVTLSGSKVWARHEDDLVRQLYPDYAALAERLPHRSYYAIRHRCRALNICTHKIPWTSRERAILRRMYPRSSHREILEALPNRDWAQIRSAAVRFGCRRIKRPYVPTGSKALDLIRKKAYLLGLTMPDLDAIAGTRRFFQRGNWYPFAAARACVKALRVLDGELTVEWQPSGE